MSLWSSARADVPLHRSALRLLMGALAVLVIFLGVSGAFMGLRVVVHNLPHDRLAERFDFATPGGVRANAPAPAKFSGYQSAFEFCEIAAALLVANHIHDNRFAVRDAFVPWLPERFGSDHCLVLRMHLDGNLPDGEVKHLKLQYMWGEITTLGLVMMVMGLHALFYLTWILTVLLLLVLAVVVVKVGSDRARLALLPVVAFAMMAGTNYYWSDIVNGMPYVLTMAALVGVALLNGVPRLRPLAPFFIFGVGCVSVHYWQNDGHNYVLAVMLPALAYFLNEDADRGRRFLQAGWHLLVYCAGFFGTYALMIAGKTWVFNQYYPRWKASPLDHVLFNGRIRFREWTYEAPIEQFGAALDRMPFFRELPLWWDMVHVPMPVMTALTMVTVLAAAATLLLVARQRPLSVAGWDVAACLLLAGLSMSSFLVDDDDPYRASRFIFLWHGLLWSVVLVGVSVVLQQGNWGLGRRIMQHLNNSETRAGGFFARAKPLRATLIIGVFVLLTIAALTVPLIRGPEDNPRYSSPPMSSVAEHSMNPTI